MNTRIQNIIGENYEIIQLLGEGSFGKTYLVKHLKTPSQYAAKHFTVPSSDPQFAKAGELFQREVTTLKQLNGYPQIPQFVDFLEENQEFYLLQEYIEGITLSNEIKPGNKLEESEVIKLLNELLNILDFVHSQNIIHRDIKPDNIIRRKKDGKLVLIDFGAVKEVITQTTSLNPKTVIGTLGYMPTEQNRGKPQFNSDIYAVGMTAISALTGLEPHELPIDNCLEVVWQNPQIVVSQELADILSKMVRYDFRDRYKSVNDVLNDLNNITPPGASQKTQVISTPIPNPASIQNHDQIDMILFALLILMGIIALLYVSGVLPNAKNTEPKKQQSLLIEKVLSLDVQ